MDVLARTRISEVPKMGRKIEVIKYCTLLGRDVGVIFCVLLFFALVKLTVMGASQNSKSQEIYAGEDAV